MHINSIQFNSVFVLWCQRALKTRRMNSLQWNEEVLWFFNSFRLRVPPNQMIPFEFIVPGQFPELIRVYFYFQLLIFQHDYVCESTSEILLFSAIPRHVTPKKQLYWIVLWFTLNLITSISNFISMNEILRKYYNEWDLSSVQLLISLKSVK